jgi:glycerol-3-phosphate dehydrogenase
MKDSNLDLRNRYALFSALEGEVFDLLIIGAGITGSGIARDAAMRGLRVALIDAGDIGAGTSSRSSKLIHGGSRYMARGDLTVVRQAANERKVLRRIAPHLSLTNPMVVPAKSKVEVQALKAFIWSYEKLGNVDKAERHEVWTKKRLQQEEPLVRSADFAGAVVFPEYLTDDARLTLGTARSAFGAGAMVATYTAVREIIREGSRARVVGAVVESTLPGDERMARVRARIVINAAGPWVDAIRLMEVSDAGKKLQLTKGIHVVMSLDRVPITRTIIMYAPDHRGLFVVPRGNYVYFGTTDTFYPKAEYWPEITHEDIDYLLNTAMSYLNVAPFTDGDIVALWSGLRPLLGEEGKKPSEISRRDEIMEGPGGLLSVAGGKLTSYRAMAEQLVDRCEKLLNRAPVHASTAEEPLPGGDFSETFELLCSRVERCGLSPQEAERAALLYGSEALAIFAQEKGLAAEVRHAVLAEGALTLEDYWVRRSARARFDEEGGLVDLEATADLMGTFLRWADAEKMRQIQFCRDIRKSEMRHIQTKEKERVIGQINR